MSKEITLPVVWAYDNVQITQDGRPWLVENFQVKRLIWRLHTGIPTLRIHKIQRSARWLERKRLEALKRAPRGLAQPRQLTIPSELNATAVPGDVEPFNRLVLEKLQDGYFRGSVAHGKHISWDIFFPQAPGIARVRNIPKPPMIRPQDQLSSKVMGFILGSHATVNL